MILRPLAVIALCAAPAYAQEAAEAQQTVTYEADFFAQFSPQTALDMAERIPGFTVSEGEERRGFSGAAGNVLIDGAAPTAKAQALSDILDRIPASEVERIELMRGAGAGVANAQSVRINIIRRAGAGEGVWSAELEQARDRRVSPAAQAAWSGRRGDAEYTLSAAWDQAHGSYRGNSIFHDAAAAFSGSEIERLNADDRDASVSGELSAPFCGR
jgi:outer membrane receptor protein involved in Fe transport